MVKKLDLTRVQFCGLFFLFDRFDFFDLGEELPDGPGDPTIQGGHRPRAAFAGSAQLHFQAAAVKINHFNRTTMILADIRIQRLNQSPNAFLGRKIRAI